MVIGLFEFLVSCVLFLIAIVCTWIVWNAFFQMRDLLKVISANALAQTELLQTHTRLLAAIANAANPVEPVEQD